MDHNVHCLGEELFRNGDYRFLDELRQPGRPSTGAVGVNGGTAPRMAGVACLKERQGFRSPYLSGYDPVGDWRVAFYARVHSATPLHKKARYHETRGIPSWLSPSRKMQSDRFHPAPCCRLESLSRQPHGRMSYHFLVTILTAGCGQRPFIMASS